VTQQWLFTLPTADLVFRNKQATDLDMPYNIRNIWVKPGHMATPDITKMFGDLNLKLTTKKSEDTVL